MDYLKNSIEEDLLKEMVVTKDVESLKSIQQTKLNEYTMLNKSLTEMMRNGAPRERIEEVKEEANESYAMFLKVKDLVLDVENELSKVTYRYYDEDKDSHQTCTATSIDTHAKEDANSSSRIRANVFDVKINDEYAIPYWHIKSVSSHSKTLYLDIYDFIDGEGTPLGKKLKDFGPCKIDITIPNSCGDRMYREVYKNCKISSVDRDAFDYDSDEYIIYHIMMQFDEVEYIQCPI